LPLNPDVAQSGNVITHHLTQSRNRNWGIWALARHNRIYNTHTLYSAVRA